MSALYLHIPFCLSKCPYCDFYSRVPVCGEIERYVAALCSDLQLSTGGDLLESIFFGGGTPSLLSAAQLERILSSANRSFRFSADIEITMEVNPGTANPEQLHGYHSAGVNRLSIGVQSLDDAQLRWLGRRHDSAQALQAVEMARRVGFERLSLDLMFSLARQTIDSLRSQCHQLRQLAPEHLSLYGLTVEEGTPFARQQERGWWQLPDEELYRDMFLLVHEQLGAMGYEHYEISNYARSGERCRHNMVYWQRKPYLGIGAGAHSFFSSAAAQGCDPARAQGWGERWASANSIDGYISALEAGVCPRQRLETFTREQAMAEAVYLALRCSDGLDLRSFHDTFGQSFSSAYSAAISRCAPHLLITDTSARLDVVGWLLYNYLIENFL